MQFDTKLAVVLRDDLAVWQKTNVTAFLVSGIAASEPVRIRPSVRQLQKIPELARDIPEVVECLRVTGEDCFVVRLHLRSMDDLEEILARFLAYGQTTTSIVHSAPIAARALPLE